MTAATAEQATRRSSRPLLARDEWVAVCPIGGAETLRIRHAVPRVPWVGQRGPTWGLFDGELHNTLELNASLDAHDEGDSPVAVLLCAYERWGAECVSRMRGAFALVVHDLATGRVLAARDPMGIHPLFYAETGDAFHFSPSTLALVADPSVSSSLNLVALADYLARRWPDPQESYFAAVRRVPPGHRLIVGNGQCVVERYWDPAPPGRPVAWIGEDDLEEFDRHLQQAVARCETPGRTGIFLSGGLDSISIAAVAADSARQAGRPPLTALSLAFPDGPANEVPIQREVARALGLPHQMLPFAEAAGPDGLLRRAVALNTAWPFPMMNIWIPAYYELGRRGRDAGCEVLLTGSGGDEWLNVSPFFIADLLRWGEFRQVFDLVGTIQRSYRFALRDTVRSTLWNYGLRPLLGLALDRMAPRYWRARRVRKLVDSTPPWIAPALPLRREMDARAPRVLPSPDPGDGGFYERELRIALDHPLMSALIEDYFEFGRMLGACVRHPYWDADLVELLCRTPPHLLTRGGRTKALVRETVGRRFPHLGLDRQKKVYATEVFRSILHHEGPAAWRELGGARALGDLGIVEPRSLEATVRRLLDGGQPAELHRVWQVLHLEVWARTWA